MNAIPTKPTVILEKTREAVQAATGIDPEWVLLTPAPELVGRMPPASTAFAAVVPAGLSFPESPQHQEICPADLRLEICLFSRVAVDRTFDGQKLLTDPGRGLFPLADRVLKTLAGSGLEGDTGQLTRSPIQVLSVEPIRWAEGQNLVLAYIIVRCVVPFLYDLTT